MGKEPIEIETYSLIHPGVTEQKMYQSVKMMRKWLLP